MTLICLSRLVLGSLALDGSYTSDTYGVGTGPMHRVECNGNEPRLRNCRNSTSGPCSPTRRAGVRCRYKGKVKFQE